MFVDSGEFINHLELLRKLANFMNRAEPTATKRHEWNAFRATVNLEFRSRLYTRLVK